MRVKKRFLPRLTGPAARFLHILLPVVAILLFGALAEWLGIPKEERAMLLGEYRNRVLCLLHCLAVGVGGAMLIDLAARDRRGE